MGLMVLMVWFEQIIYDVYVHGRKKRWFRPFLPHYVACKDSFCYT